MAPEKQPRGKVQRVLLVRGRMVERRVQGHEVVPFRVHFRAPGAREAQAAKDGPDVFYDPADRMDRALPADPPRQRQVRAGLAGPTAVRQRLPPFLHRTGNRGLDPIGFRAGRRPFLGIQSSKASEEQGHKSFPASQIADPDILEFMLITGRENGRKGVLLQLPQVLDHDALRCRMHPSVPSPARVPWPPSSGD